MFYKAPNQYIQEGNAFEINGNQYPANWLNLSTPEEKAAIGLEEVIATNQPANDTYYWVSQTLNGASLTYTNTPKDLDPCKANVVNQTNAAAYSILLPTDWMVVKATETNTTVPDAWNTWRQTIRTQAQNYVASVNACTTIDQLDALPSVQWARDPNYVEPVAQEGEQA
tara:strand:+ start:67 stop:573 length:507 start_codon:yes stop_codon:yes gene_type:complete